MTEKIFQGKKYIEYETNKTGEYGNAYFPNEEYFRETPRSFKNTLFEQRASIGNCVFNGTVTAFNDFNAIRPLVITKDLLVHGNLHVGEEGSLVVFGDVYVAGAVIALSGIHIKGNLTVLQEACIQGATFINGVAKIGGSLFVTNEFKKKSRYKSVLAANNVQVLGDLYCDFDLSWDITVLGKWIKSF